MKVDQNIELKSEHIEINIVDMIKYLFSKIIGIVVFSVIAAILLPTLVYISDKEEVAKIQENMGEGVQDSHILQNYIDSLAFYESAYEAKMEYIDNSVIMKLDYMKVPALTVQFHVKADSEKLVDIMTGFSNYAADGAIYADICAIDNSISEKYLKELIKLTCSNYSNYESSSVIAVRIYGESEEQCNKYVSIIEQVLSKYGEVLKNSGLDNQVSVLQQKYFVGQDNAIWTLQNTQNKSLEELEISISETKTKIKDLESQGIIPAKDIENADIADLVEFEIKFVILGFAIGLILAVVFVVVKYLASGKIKCYSDVSDNTNILYLGTVRCAKRGLGKKIFEGITGGYKYQAANEERLIYKLKAIYEANNKEKICLLGELDILEMKEMSDMQNKLKEENINLTVVGDVINDVKAMKTLAVDEKVVFVIKAQKTSYAYLQELMKMCAVKEADILGYIYID